MAYDDEFFDGFDTYGPTGFAPIAAGVEDRNSTLLGEWTGWAGVGLGATQADLSCTVIDSLFGPGHALRVACVATAAGRAAGLFKTLPASYARMVFGGIFRTQLSAKYQAIVFGDAGVDQLAITIETSGQIGVRRGGITGDLIALSAESIRTNEAFHLSGEITFHNSAGIVKIRLNDVPTSLQLTGQDTTSTLTDAANQVAFWATTSNSDLNGSWLDVDSFYVRGYVSGGGTDAPLPNQIVETQFPIADEQREFAFGAAILGSDYAASATTNAPGANQLILRKFTPDTDGDLDSVSIRPMTTSLTAKFTAVAYADSAGDPGALLSSGTEVVGCTSGVELVGALTSSQALVAGTPIWIGYLLDTAVALALSDATILGRKIARTYGSGAPATAGAMTVGLPSWLIFGNVSGVSENWPLVDNDPSAGDHSYVVSATPGDEDLFTFPVLSSTPSEIFSVKLTISARRSDGGARTVDLRVKSASTTGSGSNAGQAPPTNYGSLTSYFSVDPDTSAAWNASGVNLMYGGYKIAS